MGGAVYEFCSKWTKLDELLAPYSDRSFARVFTRSGAMMMAIAAILSVVMTLVAAGGVVALATAGAQRIYLQHYGATASGVIESVVPDKSNYRGRVEQATVTYRFTTAQGEVITEQMRREIWSVKGLRRGQPVGVLYAEGHPQLNLAKPGFANSGYLLYMSFLCTAFAMHLALFLRRYFAWRRRKFSFGPRELRRPDRLISAVRGT
jgi:hypothetical protein